MKKIIAIILILICCIALCACGTQKEDNSSAEVPEGMTSTLPGANLKNASTEDADEDPTFALAETFVDKPVDELISAIGEPKSREYSPSCLGDGEDGNLEYDGFYVYTYKEDGIETVKQVYK